jgi:cell division protein FtsL
MAEDIKTGFSIFVHAIVTIATALVVYMVTQQSQAITTIKEDIADIRVSIAKVQTHVDTVEKLNHREYK